MTPAPHVSLEHLDRLTDSTGLIQHAIYSVPRRQSGYTVDDNARALSLCVRLWSQEKTEGMLVRISRYLSLLEDARRSGGGFHNLMSYQRQWIDTNASSDCQGQAIRALSEVMASRLPVDTRTLAHELIESALPAFSEIRSLRAEALLLLGYGRLWEDSTSCWPRYEEVATQAAQHLAECYRRSRRPRWHWFEAQMTYANAVLPHAMFVAASLWPTQGYGEIAHESFAFLTRHTTEGAIYVPIGNNGWFPHGEAKACYDQQPIEASTMADAALAAWTHTPSDEHRQTFERAYAWFHGANSVGVALADPARGACYDGLHASGPNRNQGAESTLAFLWAQMRRHAASVALDVDATSPATGATQRTGLPLEPSPEPMTDPLTLGHMRVATASRDVEPTVQNDRGTFPAASPRSPITHVP